MSGTGSFLFFHSHRSHTRKEKTDMASHTRSRIFARLFGLVALGLLGLAALFGGSLQAQAGLPTTLPAVDTAGKIDKQVLKDTANGQSASFVILLAQQANLT